jgi:hypothetical protein
LAYYFRFWNWFGTETEAILLSFKLKHLKGDACFATLEEEKLSITTEVKSATRQCEESLSSLDESQTEYPEHPVMLERSGAGAASRILVPRARTTVALFKELSLEDTDCDLTLHEKEEPGEKHHLWNFKKNVSSLLAITNPFFILNL